MPETVSYLKDHDVTRVDSFGKTRIKDWDNSLTQVINIHKEKGTFRVLVDARQQRISPGTMDLYNFGAELPAGFRFAVVISETTIDDHTFLESVGKNRGKLIQIFFNCDEALSWLKDNA